MNDLNVTREKGLTIEDNKLTIKSSINEYRVKIIRIWIDNGELKSYTYERDKTADERAKDLKQLVDTVIKRGDL